MPKKKSKVPPLRVPSDDFVWTVEGVDYFPHEGEWVEVHRGMGWGAMQLVSQWQELQVGGRKDPSVFKAYAETTARLGAYIASRIISWSWTDSDGEALPSPTAEVINALNSEEVNYLLEVLMRVMPGKPALPSTDS